MKQNGIAAILPLLCICCAGLVSSQLASSPWPMFHHDVRHTGRSPYGPVGNWPSIKWKFQMEGLTFSSPAIDENGIVYIGAEGFHDKFFFAINPNGSEKWIFDPGEWVDSSPAISSDGTIYFGSHNGNLNALYPDGSTKWIIYSLLVYGRWVCPGICHGSAVIF